jgi:WXXGXW repeat (2 copies)
MCFRCRGYGAPQRSQVRRPPIAGMLNRFASNAAPRRSRTGFRGLPLGRRTELHRKAAAVCRNQGRSNSTPWSRTAKPARTESKREREPDMNHRTRCGSSIFFASAISIALGPEVVNAEAVIVEKAMPAPIVEPVPPQPRPGMAWVPGHWVWRPRLAEWFWVRGHYIAGVVPPMPAAIVETPPPGPSAVHVWVRGHWVGKAIAGIGIQVFGSGHNRSQRRACSGALNHIYAVSFFEALEPGRRRG